MSQLIPIALFGWIPLTIYLFFKVKPHQAAIISIIGGTLFLPMTGYDLPGLPPFTKNSVIGIGLLLGGRLSGQRGIANFRWSRYDIPMLLWCLCPMGSSLTNSLGIYDGLAGIWGNISLWGIPYLAGRIYIDDIEKLKDLYFALIIGGVIYAPLCLYEIRMSPQLNNIFYDFFPHSWIQHKRYGGWRPIVFMQHGLMVALWLSTTTTATFWAWRAKLFTNIKGLPISVVILLLCMTTILCKSANGWITLGIGICSYYIFKIFKSIKPFQLLILVIFIYMFLRIIGGIDPDTIENQTSRIVDHKRVSSLTIRLNQEELFIDRMMHQPFFGWGNMALAWPKIETNYGEKKAIQMIDSLWLIVVSTRGLIGLFAMTSMLLIGPWIALSTTKHIINHTDQKIQIIPITLSIVVILFMIDCLVNGMINPVYILISGSTLGWSLNIKELEI